MKDKIYPKRKLQPLPPYEEPPVTIDGLWAGRVVGVILSAILWALLVLWFWVGFFDIPERDYAAVASIGAIASLAFSFPYLFK